MPYKDMRLCNTHLYWILQREDRKVRSLLLQNLVLTEELPSAQAEKLIEEIPICPFPIPPQQKLIFLHSITRLSLILVWALSNCSRSDCRNELPQSFAKCHTWDSSGSQVTSKSFDISSSPKSNLYQLRTTVLARMPYNRLLYIYWGDRFLVPKNVLPSCSTQCCYSFSYRQQLLSHIERDQNTDFPGKLSSYHRTTLSQPFLFSMRRDLLLSLQRAPDVRVCGRLALTPWFY